MFSLLIDYTHSSGLRFSSGFPDFWLPRNPDHSQEGINIFRYLANIWATGLVGHLPLFLHAMTNEAIFIHALIIIWLHDNFVSIKFTASLSHFDLSCLWIAMSPMLLSFMISFLTFPLINGKETNVRIKNNFLFPVGTASICATCQKLCKVKQPERSTAPASTNSPTADATAVSTMTSKAGKTNGDDGLICRELRWIVWKDKSWLWNSWM